MSFKTLTTQKILNLSICCRNLLIKIYWSKAALVVCIRLESGEFPFANMYYDHLIEETATGLKITSTITMKGLLSFLWVQLVVKKIAASMEFHVQEQIKVASKL
jgi:hypothetical protein